MPNSIEIFQNTLLQLLVRRGPDSDRTSVVLKSGELGYTTDTNRLYVGDGSTFGGVLVGNVFAGSATNVTTLSPAAIGDLAYDSDNNKLYRLSANDGSLISDWEQIGGVYTAGDGSIVVGVDNKITVGKLSAGMIDSSMVVYPLFINGSNQLALSSVVPVDVITPLNTTYVVMPSSIQINGNIYNFPATGFVAGSVLSDVNGDGNLSWIPNSSTSANFTITGGLTATSGGTDVTGTAFNPLTAAVVIGLSPMLSSNTIYARFNGLSSDTFASIINSKGILSAIRVGTGKYRFFYNDIGTDFPVGSTMIYDLDNRTNISRFQYAGRTECLVLVYSSETTDFKNMEDISFTLTV